ncbi:hypothetical protein IP86_10735 [Rhodopseudomonas sp. AAP120]|uniref:phage tail assembly protein n=1 Tax=Rhodopseudomonas sp. AAP120 TaxID=1523430 RepID=UPI0006B88BED|nr:phage tail assembly protein [Rhodopseudomonas sp. AAP120]KPF98799.1 hypothetical protein IP86_10735 [Rhodopseudomonas sp. AAP120]
MREDLPPPVDGEPALKPVTPPPGSPDYQRKVGETSQPSGATQAAADKPAAVPPPVAILDFAGERRKVFPLTQPFDWNGASVSEITVRRLAMVDVDKLVSEKRHGDLYEIYAEMTGLPAAVLRGMDADDGEAMMEAGADFLPRSLRTAFGFTSD